MGNQKVGVNKMGQGQLSFIGLTKYDNYNNYFYGVEIKNIKEKYMEQMKDNPHIHFDDNAQGLQNKNIIFVRQNQLRIIGKEQNVKIKKTTSMKQNSKSSVKNKNQYLQIRQKQGGRRSMSLQPKKKKSQIVKKKRKQRENQMLR